MFNVLIFMKIQLHIIFRTLWLFIVFFSIDAFWPASAQVWTQTGASTNEEWQALASSADGNKLLAVSQQNVYTSTNSGITWMLASPTPSSDLWHAAASSADGMILAAGSYGGLYISTNSGASWSLNTNAPQNVWYWSIACSADGVKMIAAPYYDTSVGNPQLLYLSQDSGATWVATSAPSNHWTAVASSADGTKLIALPSNGPIYTSTNSGVSWVSNNVIAYWTSVACSVDGTKVVAVASPGQIYTSTNSGVTWVSHFVIGAGTGFGSVASSANGVRLLTVGFESSSPIFVSTNSGTSWVKQTNAPSVAIWNAVASSADGYQMFAATYGFTVNDNAGGIYFLQNTPSPKLTLTLLGTNLNLSWIVPSTNFVLQQNADLTTSWNTLTNTPILNLTNLQDQITLPLNNGNNFYRLAAP
jgi:photosystem II stability/assembly factor-like uncharacterized protein